jgi:hypothetical protein
MAVDRLPVALGKPSRGLEAHDAGGVEQQEAGPVGAGRRHHRGDGRLVHLLRLADVRDQIGDAIERVEAHRPVS